MATATRRQLDNRTQEAPQFAPCVIEQVTRVGGRVTETKVLDRFPVLTMETISVPQEDRISLDLSLAEARCIQTTLNHPAVSNSKAAGIVKELETVLFPGYNPAANQASQDAASCGPKAADPRGGGAQPGSTHRC